MKLKNINDVEAFMKVIDQCKNNVFLHSPEGDVFNLKSKLSEYIAIGRLLESNGDWLELFANSKEDEALLMSFLATLDK